MIDTSMIVANWGFALGVWSVALMLAATAAAVVFHLLRALLRSLR